MYFHHLFYEFPSLLVEFSFCPSAGTRRAHYLRLPKASAHFAKSVLFKLAIQWNKIPEETRSVENSKKFASSIRKLYDDHKYSLSGIPNFCM